MCIRDRVKESYFDLHALQQVIAITREEEAVVRSMEKTAQTGYAAGERAQVDLLKAQAEITLLKQQLLELLARENMLKARLNTLFNRRADSPLGAAVTPPATGFSGSLATLFALAATNRPEVRAAQAQIERYRLEGKLMAKESMPDYKLGLEYRDIADGDNMLMFTVGLELPLRTSKYRAGVREAQKMRAASQAAREAAEGQSAFDLQDAFFKLQTARSSLALYRGELIPQAQARFSASQAGYRTGSVDFTDLLESARFLLNARIMTAMAEGTLGMQSARLERAIGMALPANVAPAGEGK